MQRLHLTAPSENRSEIFKRNLLDVFTHNVEGFNRCIWREIWVHPYIYKSQHTLFSGLIMWRGFLPSFVGCFVCLWTRLHKKNTTDFHETWWKAVVWVRAEPETSLRFNTSGRCPCDHIINTPRFGVFFLLQQLLVRWWRTDWDWWITCRSMSKWSDTLLRSH